MEDLNVGDRVKIVDDSPLARRVLRKSNMGYGDYKLVQFGKVGVVISADIESARVDIGDDSPWWWPNILLEELPVDQLPGHLPGAADFPAFQKAMDEVADQIRYRFEAVAEVEPPKPGIAEIVFDHVVRDGKCMLQIAEIRGILSPNELPEEYFNGSPRMDLLLNGLWVTDGELAWRHFVGQLLTEEEAAALVKRMRACGKRLHDINVAARAKADEERLERWKAKGRKVVRI
jgi:hypothetical protein